MHRMVQTIRQIARDESSRQLPPALGVVKSVFTDAYTCTVALRESGIVLPKVPIATGLMGAVVPPAEGDLVIVTFLGGDIHAPVVTGRLYSEQIAPPPQFDVGQVVAMLPGGEDDTTKAFQFQIDTSGDNRSLKITLDGDVKVELEIKDGSIRFQTQDAQLTLQQSGSSDGKAELAVSGSKVTIEESGDVTVTAGGTLKLKGSQIEISADSTIKIAGQMVNLN
jgi:uncharacterized protein involved in type VI secretion and phage assembly